MLNITETDFEIISRVVYENSRIKLGTEKKKLVCARLSSRLRELQLGDFSTYCQFLRSEAGKQEIGPLIDCVATNVTHFFRELDHFDYLSKSIISEYRNKKIPDLNIWSAGCSTGEEPYSIAILLSELGESVFPFNFRILASDVSGRVLDVAREGIYEQVKVKLPNTTWLPKYFQYGTGNWRNYYRIKPTLSKRINFNRMDITESSRYLPERFDVIFCRNVIIYFDQQTARQLIANLSKRLNRGGYLFLANADMIDFSIEEMTHVKGSIFRKR